MLIKEFERIDPGFAGTKITINIEGIDVLSAYQPKGDKEPTKGACTVVLRCGMVMGLKASQASIEQMIKNYRG